MDMEKQLRLAFLLIAYGVAASFAGAQVSPSAQVPISLTISTPSSEVKAGSELKLGIALTNTTDEQIGLTTWAEDFRVDVLDSEGNFVGKAQEPNKSAANPGAGKVPRAIQGHSSSQGITIAPRGAFRLEVNLTKEFDLSKPGKYTVQATRMYGKVPVRSNVVTITALP